MRYIDQNSTELITYSLYGNCTNQYNPYFTWEIYNIQSKNSYYFSQTDSSPSPWYYNSFTISISTTFSSATAGVVGLQETGEFDLRIFETTNPNDLGLTTSVGVVFQDTLTINGTWSGLFQVTQQIATASVYRNMNPNTGFIG